MLVETVNPLHFAAAKRDHLVSSNFHSHLLNAHELGCDHVGVFINAQGYRFSDALVQFVKRTSLSVAAVERRNAGN
jgi:hypothetical protein